MQSCTKSFQPQEIYSECLHSFIFEIQEFLQTAGKTNINIIVHNLQKPHQNKLFPTVKAHRHKVNLWTCAADRNRDLGRAEFHMQTKLLR